MGIDKLAGSELATAIWKDRLDLHRSGRRINPVVHGKDAAFGELPVVASVKRLHGRVAALPYPREKTGQIVL